MCIMTNTIEANGVTIRKMDPESSEDALAICQVWTQGLKKTSDAMEWTFFSSMDGIHDGSIGQKGMC